MECAVGIVTLRLQSSEFGPCFVVHRVGRTGRLSSEHPGRAFSFVTQEEGEQLTKIEMRIDRLLDEMHFEGIDAYRSRPRRHHVVEDLETPVAPVEVVDEWDNIEM